MALPLNPDRDAIYGELTESTYAGGNNLLDLWNYVFGSGSYDRDSFGGHGRPEVADTITLNGGNQQIECTFTIDDDGGGHTMTFVAQYWEQTGDVNPSPYFEQEIGTGTGTGQFTRTITGLDNGKTYEVRITAYNLFNNSGNYPVPRGENVFWDWTNTGTETANPPQLSPPSIVTSTTGIQSFSTDLYVELTVDGAQDDIELQVEIDNLSDNHTRQCDLGVSGTNPKIVTQLSQLVQDGTHVVEVRARATGAGFTPSGWTPWHTVTYRTVPSCPL